MGLQKIAIKLEFKSGSFQVTNFDPPDFQVQPVTNLGGIDKLILVPTAAAGGNGVDNATGARVTSLPITPQKVLAALGVKEARI